MNARAHPGFAPAQLAGSLARWPLAASAWGLHWLGAGLGLRPPGSGRELDNRLSAFERFGAGLAAGAGDGGVTARQRQWLAGLSAWEQLWAAEGLGYQLASRLGREELRQALAAPALSPGWLPVHTGAGLGLAERALAGEPTREGLQGFVGTCHAVARPGAGWALAEALGLVARTLHPERLAAVGALMQEVSATAQAAFWHGAGRGLYFAPSGLLPLPNPVGRVLAKAIAEPPDEPPDELGRRNALAGLAFAVTLVNLRHPEVLAAYLAQLPAAAVWRSAFAEGVVAALRLWQNVHGAEEVLAAFVAGPAGSPLWADLVAARWRRAQAAGSADLSGRAGELFCCPAEGER